MEKEITRNELLEINDSLHYLSSKETSIWYQILKNKKKVKSLVEETIDFRKEIIEKFSKRDEAGEKITDENGNILVENPTEATEALDRLGNETVIINLDSAKISDLGSSKIEARYIEPLLEIMLTEE